MAITWPATLPAPSRTGLSIKPAVNVLARRPQSGRQELRRFGSGGHDELSCTIRLWLDHPEHGDQVAIFESFFKADLNLGINWIDAAWLADLLGYSSHYLRLAGYLRRSIREGLYADYQLQAHIKKQSATWPDSSWPVWG